MKKYFILICKTSNGAIYPSTIMCAPDDLQGSFANLTAIGVKVIDLKAFEFNPAEYE